MTLKTNNHDLFAPTLRTFLHCFVSLDTVPTRQELDYWKYCLATLDNQLRPSFLDDVGGPG